jgi:hypothetical protein
MALRTRQAASTKKVASPDPKVIVLKTVRASGDAAVSMRDIVAKAREAGISESDLPRLILELERAGNLTVDWDRNVRFRKH